MKTNSYAFAGWLTRVNRELARLQVGRPKTSLVAEVTPVIKRARP